MVLTQKQTQSHCEENKMPLYNHSQFIFDKNAKICILKKSHQLQHGAKNLHSYMLIA